MNLIIETKKQRQLEDLPEDIWFIVLSYMPLHVRLTILRKKYPYNEIKRKLVGIDSKDKLSSILKLYRIALKSQPIIQNCFGTNIDVYFRLTGIYLLDKQPKNCEICKNSNFYKRKFIEIIAAAFHHYVKLYKKEQQILPKKMKLCEKNMLHLYCQILNL